MKHTLAAAQARLAPDQTNRLPENRSCRHLKHSASHRSELSPSATPIHGPDDDAARLRVHRTSAFTLSRQTRARSDVVSAAIRACAKPYGYAMVQTLQSDDDARRAAGSGWPLPDVIAADAQANMHQASTHGWQTCGVNTACAYKTNTMTYGRFTLGRPVCRA